MSDFFEQLAALSEKGHEIAIERTSAGQWRVSIGDSGAALMAYANHADVQTAAELALLRLDRSELKAAIVKALNVLVGLGDAPQKIGDTKTILNTALGTDV